MLRQIQHLLVPFVLALALTSALPAAAQTSDSNEEVEARGRELFENGSLLYDEGRYEDAIFAWEEGHRLTGRPGFLFNIANAQERLGDYAAALDTLGRYRALARADERETLDRRIRNLEERRAAEPVPVPAPVPSLLPDPAPVPDPQPLPPKTASRLGRSIVGGTMIGTGVLGLGLGTAFGLRSRSAADEANGLCIDGNKGLLCPVGAESALANNRRSAMISDISFIAGSLLGVSGAVVLVTGRKTTVSIDPIRTMLRLNRPF